MNELLGKLTLIENVQTHIRNMMKTKYAEMEKADKESPTYQWLTGTHWGLTLAFGELELHRENLLALCEREEAIFTAEYDSYAKEDSQ